MTFYIKTEKDQNEEKIIKEEIVGIEIIIYNFKVK